jgi:hypothetical protein
VSAMASAERCLLLTPFRHPLSPARRAISSHIHAAIFAGECQLVDTHHDALLNAFVDACHAAGGPLLDLDELRLHVRPPAAFEGSERCRVRKADPRHSSKIRS